MRIGTAQMSSLAWTLRLLCCLAVFQCVTTLTSRAVFAQSRQSAREMGIVVCVLPPGPLNAIPDVAGVRVGQVTIVRGDSVNTGFTAILPHGENPFSASRPAPALGVLLGRLSGALLRSPSPSNPKDSNR